MKLPFTVEQFLEIFKKYNQAVYPMQIIFYLLAALVVFLSVKSITNASKIINSILAFLWFWMGIVYHLLYFSQVNKAAYFSGSFLLSRDCCSFTRACLITNYPIVSLAVSFELAEQF
jgi:hypothetical protein